MGAYCTEYSAQVQICMHETRERQLYCRDVCVCSAEVEALTAETIVHENLASFTQK